MILKSTPFGGELSHQTDEHLHPHITLLSDMNSRGLTVAIPSPTSASRRTTKQGDGLEQRWRAGRGQFKL